MKPAILITGATGFVGNALVHALRQRGNTPVCISRQAATIDGIACQVMADQGKTSNWRHHLEGIQVIVHCAARVHMMHDRDSDPLAAYREVNVENTLNLARQAAASGVRQFIFLSSIKVNGEGTALNQAYNENSPPQPVDAYGISKLEAETALLSLAENSSMSVTILRPPLVYGPGVKANFQSLLRSVNKGLPLPLGSIHNQRSFVYVSNLVDLICHCMLNTCAYNQVFLVTDGQDMSTTELLQYCAIALDRSSRVFPFPPALITLAANLIGRKTVAQRLCQSLRVDSSKTQRVLGWTPPFSVQQGLRATAQAYLNTP